MTDPRITTICTMNFPLMRGEIVDFVLTFAFAFLLVAAAFALICRGIEWLRGR